MRRLESAVTIIFHASDRVDETSGKISYEPFPGYTMLVDLGLDFIFCPEKHINIKYALLFTI